MAQRLSGGLQPAKSGSDAIWAKPGKFNTQIMAVRLYGEVSKESDLKQS
jgi:hypothetical protein